MVFTLLLMRNGIRTEKQQPAYDQYRPGAADMYAIAFTKVYCRESPRCSSIVNNAICGDVLGDKSSVVVFDMKTNALI